MLAPPCEPEDHEWEIWQVWESIPRCRSRPCRRCGYWQIAGPPMMLDVDDEEPEAPMLDNDELKYALLDAIDAAGRCSRRYCRSHAAVVEGGYVLEHTGIGSDTAVQTVHAKGILDAGAEVMKSRLKEWLLALHDPRRQGPPPDFNEYAER